MKQATDTVKIGFVRRRSISLQPNQYQTSPNEQNHQISKKQSSRTLPTSNDVRDQPYFPTPTTPRHVRLNDINEAKNANPLYSDIPSLPPSPLSAPTAERTTNVKEQTTTTPSHEIPSKTKWSTRKKIIVGVSVSLLVCTLIIVSTVLAVLLTRTTTTDTTITTTLSSTTVSPTIVSVTWSFDGTVTDLYGVYNGLLFNGATYSTVALNQPYFGYGQALMLIAASSQSFLVSSPFLDLTSTSFTIEGWIYLFTTFGGDRGIFGQCQCLTCSNQCLYFLVRANRLFIGFTSNDLAGSMTLVAATWYHVAFVYNYQTQQQILYVNGVQDAIKSSAPPYQGKNGTIQIGSAQALLTPNYFNGYIDNVKVTTRAKPVSEILTDASLVAHYTFDSTNPNSDSGTNGLNGTLTNTISVIGRVNQAMRFTGSASYFQAYGFYQLPYGVSSNKQFSISMWINPSVASGCTFAQVSTIQSGGTCTNHLGIMSITGTTGQISAQGYNWPWPTIFGPYVTVNTWTHISWTYSSTNGYSLYVNGVFFGSTGAYGYSSSGVILWLQIGFSFTCSTGYLPNTAYQGAIDEIYVHNRELAASDVYALANP